MHTPYPETLKGKVALVTGGSSGIGSATVKKLISLGAKVVYTGTSLPTDPKDNLDGSIAIRCDNRSLDDLQRIVQYAASLGSLDILVNCAGVSETESIENLTLESWDRTLETNLRGTIFAIKFATHFMRQQQSGSIINVASVSGFSTITPGNTSYVASKGAQLSLTRSLVYELAPHGIRVNAVAPGFVQTRIIDQQDDWINELSQKVPAGRVSNPDEIANIIAFLASDDASYINGHTIVADGGISAVTFAQPT